MNKGLQKGIQQGVKRGQGHSNIQSGLKQGIQKSTGTKDRTHSQDPRLLKGVKKPLVFCIADFYTQPTTTTTTLLDIANTGYTLTCAAGGSYRPVPTPNDIFNKFTSVDFPNTASFLVPNPTLSLTGLNAITVIMVVKLKKIAAAAIFTIDDTTTPGGLNVNILNTSNTISTTFYGGLPGSITNSVYNSIQPTSEMEEWMILTVKVRFQEPQIKPTGTPRLGAGSEQETYVNGIIQKKLVSTSPYTNNTTAQVFVSGQNIIVGNDNSILSGTKGNGIRLGGIVVLPYYANSSEQVRLENYWRSYYGYKF
jgi:hypothetical protein